MLFIRNTYIRNNEHNHTVQNNCLEPQIKNRHKKTQLLYHNNLLKNQKSTTYASATSNARPRGLCSLS